MGYYLLAFVLLAGGSFSFMGAMKNRDSFMRHDKVRSIARRIGPGGARLFYAALGLIMCLVGLAILAFGVPG